MSGRPKTAGVIGWPVAHSLSPLIHMHWAEREGVDAAYLPILVEPGGDNLRRAVAALRGMGFAGVNVTVPHKEDALALADTASDAARAVGAANMLTFHPDSVHAHNSDAAGFATAIDPLLPRQGRLRALVLGAGGAAQAVVRALTVLEVRGRRIEVQIANRGGARAEEVARRLGGVAIPWETRSAALSGVDLLINATSLGMSGFPPLEIDLTALPATALVADIVYSPLETGLLKAARARDLKTMDGLQMLMEQAVHPYQCWLGSMAPVDDALRLKLEAALLARERA
jgi:shikimate dehydrogenase